MSRRLASLLLPLGCGVLFVALWYGVRAWLGDDYRFLLPSPEEVLAAAREHATELGRAAFNTTVGALLGFALAIAVSVAAALLLALSPLIRVSLYPYLMLLQLTPVIVVAPILILWVGAGLKSVVAITFLICFFPMVVNTTQGLVSTDRQLVELFTLWRASPLQKLLLLRVPAALPYFFTGLRIAATLAPIGALVGDYTAGSSAGDGGGLGFQALVFSSRAQYAALFATAAITCVLGFLFVGMVMLLSRAALRHWHDAYDRPDL